MKCCVLYVSILRSERNDSISGICANQDNQYTQLRKSVMNGDVGSVESIIKSQTDNKWNIDMAAEEGSNLLFL